ncbi:hypothetical protein BaRGS_00003062, partial [Batillaria attramentaria]
AHGISRNQLLTPKVPPKFYSIAFCKVVFHRKHASATGVTKSPGAEISRPLLLTLSPSQRPVRDASRPIHVDV